MIPAILWALVLVGALFILVLANEAIYYMRLNMEADRFRPALAAMALACMALATVAALQVGEWISRLGVAGGG